MIFGFRPPASLGTAFRPLPAGPPRYSFPEHPEAESARWTGSRQEHVEETGLRLRPFGLPRPWL